MIRRPPRSTLSSSSAASDVYKRQVCLSRKLHQKVHVRETVADPHRRDDRHSRVHCSSPAVGLDMVCRCPVEVSRGAAIDTRAHEADGQDGDHRWTAIKYWNEEAIRDLLPCLRVNVGEVAPIQVVELHSRLGGAIAPIPPVP